MDYAMDTGRLMGEAVRRTLLSGHAARGLSHIVSARSYVFGEEAISEILPGELYLGNLAGANSADELHRLGVTDIVAITQFGDSAIFHPDAFRYHAICIDDYVDADIFAVLPAAVTFIADVLNTPIPDEVRDLVTDTAALLLSGSTKPLSPPAVPKFVDGVGQPPSTGAAHAVGSSSPPASVLELPGTSVGAVSESGPYAHPQVPLSPLPSTGPLGCVVVGTTPPVSDATPARDSTAKDLQRAVYVHCNRGKSRSVTVVMAYLMAAKGLCLSEALAFTRERRWIAEPNAGFMRALAAFEAVLGGTCTPDSQEGCERKVKRLEAEKAAGVIKGDESEPLVEDERDGNQLEGREGGMRGGAGGGVASNSEMAAEGGSGAGGGAGGSGGAAVGGEGVGLPPAPVAASSSGGQPGGVTDSGMVSTFDLIGLHGEVEGVGVASLDRPIPTSDG